jgi:hypothetical protein
MHSSNLIALAADSPYYIVWDVSESENGVSKWTILKRDPGIDQLSGHRLFCGRPSFTPA